MNDQDTLQIIRDNNAALDRMGVKRVLILYEEKIFLIGDACINFNELRYFRTFFPAATVQINFLNQQNKNKYEALLTNNPFLDDITLLPWSAIDFSTYNVVVCVTYNEVALLQFLQSKYASLIQGNRFATTVFSISQVILQPEENVQYIFPVNDALARFVQANPVNQPLELYITPEERVWANRWLQSKGLGANEDLFIILDSTTSRTKLLDINVYAELLSYMLSIEHAKVLIFDEKNIGKQEFYGELLGEAAIQKIIFSNGLTLRQDLSIIGSAYTKLVFGPCTGLLHCASSIFNNYVRNGLPIEAVPFMLSYTGHYPPGQRNAAFWWSNAPLVNCVWMQQSNNGKELVLLNNMTEKSTYDYKPLPCSEYTASLLIDFINEHWLYQKRTTRKEFKV